MKRNFKVARPLFCAVDGCEGRRRAKGLCEAHYKRLRSHGDPLGGGTPSGSALGFYNDVVLKHDVDECLDWPFFRDGKGYGQLGDGNRTRRVYRLVCEHFNGPPPTPKHVAAHRCGRSCCVAKKHLRWASQSENEIDKLLHGVPGQTKLTADQVQAIRSSNGRQSDVAAEHGVTATQVGRIQRGERWSWLPSPTQQGEGE